MKDIDGKMIQPNIEVILKLLIDRQTGQDSGTGKSKFYHRVFKAAQGSKHDRSYRSTRQLSTSKSREGNQQLCKHGLLTYAIHK